MSSTPSTAHDHPGNGSEDRRRSPRQRIDALVYIELGSSNGGFPINVTEEGLAFQGIQRLKIDQVVSIRFKLPDLGNPLEVTGQIVWLNELGTGGGLRFIDLSDEARLVIRNWISAGKQPTSHEGKKEKSPVPAIAPAIAPAPVPAPAAAFAPAVQLPARESSSAAAINNQIVIEVVQEPSRHLAGETMPTLIAAPISSSPDSKVINPESRLRTFLSDPGGKQERHVPVAIWLIAGVVLLAVVGLISWKHSRSALVSTSSVSTPAPMPAPVAQPSIPESLPVAVASSARPVAVASSARPVAPHPAVTTKRLKVNPPKNTPQQLAALTAAMVPTAVPNYGATKISPPSFGPPARTQPGPLPSMATPGPSVPVLFPTISVEPSVRPVVQPSVKPVVELEAAQLLVRHNAVYPPVARAARISGPVELQFTVGVDGRVRNVKVMKGNGLLAQAAVTAVKSWRYRPARRGGVPLESQSTAVVNFKLN